MQLDAIMSHYQVWWGGVGAAGDQYMAESSQELCCALKDGGGQDWDAHACLVVMVAVGGWVEKVEATG